jgi:hypothetical protein
LTQTYCSLDEKKAQAVVDEVTAAGGDAIAVGGDVAADDFPAKVLDATIKYAQLIPRPTRLRFLRRALFPLSPSPGGMAS